MSKDELSRLKAAVLEAILNKQALPGSQEFVSFPDLPLLLNQPGIYILDQEMKSSISTPLPNKELHPVTVGELNRLADTNGELYYLQLEEDRAEDGKVVLKLILQHKRSGEKPFPLSQVHLPYKKSGGGWQLSGQPAALSS